METLAAAAIGLAAPYLAKGAEAFASATGGAAFDAVKALVARLHRWWSSDPVATAAAESFATNPEENSKLLGRKLSTDLAGNADLAADLRALVDNVGPYVEIVQNIEIARNVTGAKIKAMVEGTIRVEQTMKSADNITGVEIKTLGKKK